MNMISLGRVIKGLVIFCFPLLQKLFRWQVWSPARKGGETSEVGSVLWRLTQLCETPCAINAFSLIKSIFVCVSFCVPVISVYLLHNFTHEHDQTVHSLSFLLIPFAWYHPWQGGMLKASLGIWGSRMWSMSVQCLAPSTHHIGTDDKWTSSFDSSGVLQKIFPKEKCCLCM